MESLTIDLFRTLLTFLDNSSPALFQKVSQYFHHIIWSEVVAQFSFSGSSACFKDELQTYLQKSDKIGDRLASLKIAQQKNELGSIWIPPLRNLRVLENTANILPKQLDLPNLRHLRLKKMDWASNPQPSFSLLTSLRTLIIEDSSMTKIQFLSTLSSLMELTLPGNKNLGVREFVFVTQLSNLEYLNLTSCPFSSRALSYLSRIPSLTTLVLARTAIQEVALKFLTQLSRLRSLDVSYCECIGGAASESLAKMTTLTELLMSQNLKLRGTQFAFLAPLVHMKTLNVSKNFFYQDSLISIASFTSLVSLNLMNTDIQNIGPLKDLTLLTRLSLSG